MHYYIGIDNGVTGSICILNENGSCLHYAPTPVKQTLNYTKEKEFIMRVVVKDMAELLMPYREGTVVLERPMLNPLRWTASVSAIRCDEATRGVIEALGMKLIYVDSKEWQSEMLPNRKAISRLPKGSTNEAKKAQAKLTAAYAAETKKLSLMCAQRLFPNLEFKKDGDAALIAEWVRKNKL
jgi:hypothetical protein